MTRYMLAVFGSLVLAISMSAPSMQAEVVRPFLSTEAAFLWGRPLVGLLLIGYASFPFLNGRLGQRLMMALGGGLLGFLLADVLAPEYFGLSNVYLLPLDIYCVAGSGIMATLGSLDLKAKEEPLPLRSWLRQRLALELQNLTSTRYRKLTA